MRTTMFHTLAVLAAGALSACALAQQPPPQTPPRPNFPQPSPLTQGTGQVAAPVYQSVPVVNTGAYAPVYPGAYPTSRYGSALSGAADLTTARANASVTYQQSRAVQNDVYNAQLQTRQLINDQARYERGTTMSSEDVRIQKQIDALRRARNDPPLNEIWAGDSLNVLFDDIKKAHAYGIRGPSVPVDQDALKHLNLSTGVVSGNLGALKDGPKVKWPTVLQDPRFENDRKKIELLNEKALMQAMTGQVDRGMISDMRDTLETMGVKLKQMVKEVSPSPYMDGKRFLRELDESYVVLKDPNVSNFFTGKWSPQGSTVYDLVDGMTKKGLRFGPATAADKTSYTALYQSLLTYNLQLTQTASR